MGKEVEKTYVIYGKVQNVMFRQTFIRACESRGLEGGATNTKTRNKVYVTLKGDARKVKELVDILKSGKIINSWRFV